MCLKFPSSCRQAVWLVLHTACLLWLETSNTLVQPLLGSNKKKHCAALLKCRGSKGFGGGRHRIDNWPKLLHHAGFLLENGQNMHGRHIADARLHYQTISVLPYHHTDTTQLANMQKSPVHHIVTAAHLHDDLQYWNLFLVPLWCGCWVASWRGCVVLKHSPVCHNPFITITDTAAAATLIATIYFILTVRWNTPELCVQFDVFYGFYFV